MAALVEALKPMLKETVKDALRDELGDRLVELERKVDQADQQLQNMKNLDPRIAKPEEEMRELKRKVTDMESRLGSASTASSGHGEPAVVPSFLEIKGFCTWEQRRQKGLTRSQATQFYEKFKEALSGDLKEHFGESMLSGLFNYKIKIQTTPKHTLDIKSYLIDLFTTEERFKINDQTPYVVPERTLEAKRRFATYGKVVDVVRKANAFKQEQQELVVEPRYRAVFMKPVDEDEQVRPSFIAEVLDDCSVKWDDAICQRFFALSADDLEARRLGQ